SAPTSSTQSPAGPPPACRSALPMPTAPSWPPPAPTTTAASPPSTPVNSPASTGCALTPPSTSTPKASPASTPKSSSPSKSATPQPNIMCRYCCRRMRTPPTEGAEVSEIILGKNQYGKAENRVVRIYRDTPRHEIHDINVSTCL